MQRAVMLENAIIKELKVFSFVSLQDNVAQIFLKKANELFKEQALSEAANRFAALAEVVGEEGASLALQAAEAYDKSGDTTSAARCFLNAANAFAKNDCSKAVAALGRYRQLKPDDVSNLYRIYKKCAEESLAAKLQMHRLSAEDSARHRLVSSQLFEDFDEASLNVFLQGLRYRKFKSGEVLCKMGEKAQCLFIVMNGKLTVYLTAKGKRIGLGDIGENDICGETAYFTGGRRMAEIIAKSDVDFFELPYALLDRLHETSIAFKRMIKDKYELRMLSKQLALSKIFANVSATVLAGAVQHIKVVSLKAGDTLFREGDLGVGLYIVRQGELALTIDTKGGEVLIQTMAEGGVVGEISILTGGKRIRTVRAVTDTVLMHMQEEGYKTCFKQSPELQQSVQQAKQAQVKEILNLRKNSKPFNGDDTSSLLLQNIWKEH